MKKKKIFYALFLFCLFLSKVGSFHGYSHNDSPNNKVEHCDFCHMATKNDIGDFLGTQNSIEFKPVINTFSITEIEYTSELIFTSFPIKLINRPPPSSNL
ncbi:hypothetical protein [Aurantibacter sp.]|uniref:hypothetical protein n=1 Tax=Aurantibacter sp. TaxID=2807103 RepID=UPI0032657CBF